MNNSPKKRLLKIAEIGTLDISLLVIQMGKGCPKITLTCGLHGSEKTGLLVLEKLLSSEELKLRKGQLVIIPSANPLAQALGVRDTPIEQEETRNLNRAFPGQKQGELTARLANLLFSQVKDSDCLIDFHTFGLDCPLVGIFINQGTKEVKDKCLELLKIFSPEIIWQVKTTTKSEPYLIRTLGSYLAIKRVPNFAIELPKDFSASERQIHQSYEGIIRVLAHFGMINKNFSKKEKRIAIFERKKYVRASVAGIFHPQKQLFSEIKKGEIVGTVTSLRDFKLESIISPFSGVIILISKTELVKTGDRLFSVGVKMGYL